MISQRTNPVISDGGRDIETIVSNAIGDSVTPSRILNPGDVGLIRRLLGHESVDGPIDTYLNPDEQVHYLLHSTSSLSFPEEQDEFDDDNFTLSDAAFVSPVVAMVTNERIVLIYKNEGEDRVISISHSEITDISYHDSKIENKLEVQTSAKELEFGMWVTDPYASELTDAAAFVYNKAELDGGYRETSAGIGDYETAREEFLTQLNELGNLAERVDTKRVVDNGVRGAGMGRTPKTAGIGFTLAAGYTIYDELSDAPIDADIVEEIDPDRAAERIVKFQRAATRIGDRRAELAAGALAAALEFDSATPGQEVPTAIKSIDVEWVTRPLESGDTKQGAIRVASEVVDSYSSDIASLLDEAFIEDME